MGWLATANRVVDSLALDDPGYSGYNEAAGSRSPLLIRFKS